MHEMSIAINLIDHVVAAAEQAGAEGVEEIVVEAGAMKLVVPEALDLAFASVAEGTCAEGAKVSVVETPAEAKCNRCGREFGPAVNNYVCPGCGQADVEITAGDAIILRQVLCRMPGDPRGPAESESL